MPAITLAHLCNDQNTPILVVRLALQGAQNVTACLSHHRKVETAEPGPHQAGVAPSSRKSVPHHKLYLLTDYAYRGACKSMLQPQESQCQGRKIHAEAIEVA